MCLPIHWPAFSTGWRSPAHRVYAPIARRCAAPRRRCRCGRRTRSPRSTTRPSSGSPAARSATTATCPSSSAARGAPDQPLERANELKALLADRIARLKPRDGGDFGTTEQWRHYNALYFPYVVGVRAYAQNATAAGLDPVARQAWQWFVTEVPQRSLHNWQNAAARLIAADLRGNLVSAQD